jgi:hypothetical protein
LLTNKNDSINAKNNDIIFIVVIIHIKFVNIGIKPEKINVVPLIMIGNVKIKKSKFAI